MLMLVVEAGSGEMHCDSSMNFIACIVDILTLFLYSAALGSVLNGSQQRCQWIQRHMTRSGRWSMQ